MSILGLTNGGHDSYYIRFMPSRLAWVIKVKDDLDTWEDQEVPIKYLVLNPASLRTGWGKIAEGMSPEWEWDNEVAKASSSPGGSEDKAWKRGFTIDLYDHEVGVRSWSTNGVGNTIGFETLWTELQPILEKNPDSLPVIEYTGCVAKKIGKGSTQIPQFTYKRAAETDPFAEHEEQQQVYEEPEAVIEPALEAQEISESEEEIPF